MAMRTLFAAAFGCVLVAGCFGGGGDRLERQVVEEVTGGANPYLWRASLDTFTALPLASQPDPIGGIIVYDWRSFEDSPNERIKATVYILDTRLRADGVKVAVFRQERVDGEWVDAAIDPATGIQLENAILDRARRLRLADIG